MDKNEVTYSREEIIDICSTLGRAFAGHFIAIAKESEQAVIRHHAMEMQALYEEVKCLKFAHNSRFLNEKQIFDWFITLGSTCDIVCGDDNTGELYCRFADDLLDETDSVMESLQNIGVL